MAKLTKEELLKKISDVIEDKDLSIELMEDITDSVEDQQVDDILDSNKDEEIESLKMEVESLKDKYKQRFLNPEEVKEELKEDEDVPEEQNIVDVKEI